MPPYTFVSQPARIPVPGGKLIEEIFGRVNTGTDTFSLAHMIAPPNWSEPPQRPEFGELTLVVRGRLSIDIGNEEIVVASGQAVWVEPAVRVHYRNPFSEECEYYALCLPAFSPETAGREE